MNAQTIPPNVELIGGEMLGVADGDAGRAGGAALEYLAGTVASPGARVLVAGPHHEDLIRALVTRGAQVTCLLRAYADAEAIAIALPDVRVLAGSLSKLEAPEPFDAVIALDGCHRLCSVEGIQLGWDECLDVLGTVLAPRGVLLLAIANPLGIDRLVALPAMSTGQDESAPAGVGEIAGRVGVHRAVAALYGGYPSAMTPSLLYRIDAATPVASPTLGTLAAAACAQGFAGQPVLTDPRALAATAVRAGAGTELAAGWIVALTASGAAAPSLPSTVVADRPGDAGFAAAYELDGASGMRRPVPAAAYRSGALARDSARLSGPVPAGRMLDELLLSMAVRRDAPAMRQALHAYVTWLGTLDDMVTAVPANVVVADGTYTRLDPSWTWTASVRTDAARARALRLLAVELVGGGIHHPWPSTVGVDELTVLLAAAAGSPVEPGALAAGIELDLEVRSAMDGLDAAGRDALRTAITDPRPASPRVDLDGYRELQAALARERQEVARLQALTEWYGRSLSLLEDSLHRSERQVALFSGSIGYRSAKLVVTTAKRSLRPVKRQVKNLMGR